MAKGKGVNTGTTLPVYMAKKWADRMRYTKQTVRQCQDMVSAPRWISMGKGGKTGEFEEIQSDEIELNRWECLGRAMMKAMNLWLQRKEESD